MTKFQVSYKLALAVLVLPTLVFFYLVGMSAFNGTGFLSAEESTISENMEVSQESLLVEEDIVNESDTETTSIDLAKKDSDKKEEDKKDDKDDKEDKEDKEDKDEKKDDKDDKEDKEDKDKDDKEDKKDDKDDKEDEEGNGNGQEVCPETGDGWKKYDNWPDEQTEQSHDAGVGYIVTEVCVKGSTDIHYFKADGEMYCWEVEGIGKQIAKVSETWTDISAAVVKCHDISHASFKVELVPTATPTETPVVTPTETPVVTPTATSTPTVTPTEGQILGIDATAVPTTTPVYQARVLAVTGNSMYAPVGVGMIIMGLAMILGTDSVLLKRK